MKFLTYLQEEYCDLYKNWGVGVEVYENPTADDLKVLKNVVQLRFTAVNSTKKLFVWDASKSNHDDMVRYLVKRKHIKWLKIKVSLDPDLFNGFAEISGRKLSMGESDDFVFFSIDNLKDRLTKDWDWLKPYFVDLDYIYDLQRDLELEQKE